MGSISKEVDRELLPILRVYKDGSVERYLGSRLVPAFTEDPETGDSVSCKDITVSEDPAISARIFLPKLTDANRKVPVLVYYHGGGFCFESAFSLTETTHLKRLVSLAEIIAVSIEYRLAPEQPLPVVYQDCWSALQWVTSHSTSGLINQEPWLSNHGDFTRVFIGGDSAGANLAHNVTMRAGKESLPGDVKIEGMYVTHPYFWGSKPIGNEPGSGEREKILPYRVWSFLYPSAEGGIDSPLINPFVPGAPTLAGLGCSRLLVTVAEEDELRDRGVLYYNAVKKSGWKGEAELIEVEGEGHAFHIDNFETENAKSFIKRLAPFFLK